MLPALLAAATSKCSEGPWSVQRWQRAGEGEHGPELRPTFYIACSLGCCTSKDMERPLRARQSNEGVRGNVDLSSGAHFPLPFLLPRPLSAPRHRGRGGKARAGETGFELRPSLTLARAATPAERLGLERPRSFCRAYRVLKSTQNRFWVQSL